IDQEKFVAFLARIELEEIFLGHQQSALKNAVLQQADDAQLDHLAMLVRHFQLAAQFALEHPCDGVCLADYWNGVVLTIEQAPWVLAFLLGFGLAGTETETATLD